MNQTLKILFVLTASLAVAKAFDLGSIVSGTTSFIDSSLTSLTSKVDNTTASITSSAMNIINSSVNQLANTANSIIASTKSEIGSLKVQATTEIDTVLRQFQSQTRSIIVESTNTVNSFKDTLEAHASAFASQAEQTINLAISEIEDKTKAILDSIDSFSQQMCESECTSFFNLPCFLLFRCSDKIRNFFLILALPILIVIVMVVGCGTGLFNLSCFCKFLKIITGVSCILWLIQRKKQTNNEGSEVEKANSIKVHQKQEIVCLQSERPLPAE